METPVGDRWLRPGRRSYLAARSRLVLPHSLAPDACYREQSNRSVPSCQRKMVFSASSFRMAFGPRMNLAHSVTDSNNAADRASRVVVNGDVGEIRKNSASATLGVFLTPHPGRRPTPILGPGLASCRSQRAAPPVRPLHRHAGQSHPPESQMLRKANIVRRR